MSELESLLASLQRLSALDHLSQQQQQALQPGGPAVTKGNPQPGKGPPTNRTAPIRYGSLMRRLRG